MEMLRKEIKGGRLMGQLFKEGAASVFLPYFIVLVNMTAHKRVQQRSIIVHGTNVSLLTKLTIKIVREEIAVSNVLSNAEAPPRNEGLTETAFVAAFAKTGANPIE